MKDTVVVAEGTIKKIGAIETVLRVAPSAFGVRGSPQTSLVTYVSPFDFGGRFGVVAHF